MLHIKNGNNNTLFMFSVIIPLYNKSSYIDKALHSLINQTFQNFEVIIVDDGSTDGSVQRVEELFQSQSLLPDKYKLIKQPNQGVSTARNNGVKLAVYDFIAFLDADDWWSPEYLENMKQLIEKYPEAGIYASSYYKVKYGKITPARIGVDDGFLEGLINYFQVYAKTLWMPVWTGATIIKKAIFEELEGFKPQLKLGEDFDLWVRVAEKYPVAFINKPLAFYNQDVEVNTRAVGVKLYEPHEHMLFTAYNENLQLNQDFVFLFERLALYGLLPYYLSGKNQHEIKQILMSIHWEWHEAKCKFYYRIMPICILRIWFSLKSLLSKMKRKVLIKL